MTVQLRTKRSCHSFFTAIPTQAMYVQLLQKVLFPICSVHIHFWHNAAICCSNSSHLRRRLLAVSSGLGNKVRAHWHWNSSPCLFTEILSYMIELCRHPSPRQVQPLNSCLCSPTSLKQCHTLTSLSSALLCSLESCTFEGLPQFYKEGEHFELFWGCHCKLVFLPSLSVP